MSKKKKSKKNDKALHTTNVSKRNLSPSEPPKDREIHLFGFSRHKRD